MYIVYVIVNKKHVPIYWTRDIAKAIAERDWHDAAGLSPYIAGPR